MHLDLERDDSGTFPDVDDPDAITSARVWMCKYRTLEPLGELKNLRQLEIASYPDDTLAPVARLAALEDLRILHLPKVSDLRPLAGLSNLRRVKLERFRAGIRQGKSPKSSRWIR